MSGKSKASATDLSSQLPQGDAARSDPVVPCAANKDPQLTVKVYAVVKGKRRSVQATVTANALSLNSVANTGVADFSYVRPDTYRIKASAIVAPDDQEFYASGDEQQVTLVKGDKRNVELEVKPRNVVTPEIKLEYKVVVFDRDLARFQTAAGEAASELLRPDPTYVEVSIQCSEDDPPYTGAGAVAASNCLVYLDAACTQPLGGRKLTSDELKASPATRLYLRGSSRGRFQLSLTLDDPADPRFLVKPPATEDMGVVALELEIYQHATTVNVAPTTYPLTGFCTDLENANLIPQQVVLTDDDKVRKGRVLHAQSGGHHGRAKAVVKLTSAEWPPETDDYEIVLATEPAELRAFDAEVKGKAHSLPLKTKVSELKAKDGTFWIEGVKASAQIRGTRLSLALDRAAGGLTKSRKENADWARFTVVKIDSVTLEVTDPPAGQPKPWNASKRRWYINYQPGDLGRTIKIRAKLSKPIEGIKLHFMLSPDKNNLKEKNWGVDLPGAWPWDTVATGVKQKDKTNATDLLHLPKETDVEGKADCDLVLSCIGGDQFWPGVYITQDPHLAAYAHGHATLEKRKPKLADNAIKVWRKFAYQKIKVTGNKKYPSTGTAEGVYGRVRAEMLKRPSVYVAKATVEGWPKPSLLPEYMFKVGGSKKPALNVSDANQNQFFATVAAEGEHPIKVPIVTCDFNWANERDSALVAGLTNLVPGDFPKNVLTDVHVCDPPLQGGALLVSGDWTAFEVDGSGARTNVRVGVLAPGDVDVDRKRTNINMVRVNLPAGIGPATAGTRIDIANLVVQGAPDDYLGGYKIQGASNIVCLYDPKDPVDYQNTIVHELGHALGQTGNAAPAAGIPVNPNLVVNTTGNHCTYAADKCVMFTSGPIAGSLNRYCPDCHPYMLVQDMSSLS